MVAVQEELRVTHDQNKREMFDGMRAYHTSEIMHKQDAVKMYTTLMLVTSAILATIALADTVAWMHVFGLFLYSLLLTILVEGLTRFTSNKIESDNKRYREFLEEYFRCCAVLELHNTITTNHGEVRVKKEWDGQHGGGYADTIKLIRKMATIVELLAWITTVIGAIYFIQPLANNGI